MAVNLRPPINRAMKSLDRSFFNLVVPISAARISQNQFISNIRSQLIKSKDVIEYERMSPIRPDPENVDRKCILLRTTLKHNDTSTWGETILDLVKSEQIGIIPYKLNIDYNHFTYSEIINAILPEGDTDEIPTGFQIVGHVAHFNLRDQYLPYKELIATILMDKNQTIKTVINKIDTVGEESQYRTFSYEVLAGPDDMDVTVKEQDCVFDFNYAKVYWNSRLSTEHERLVDEFYPGTAVCDVMAGIGPFALPAGKKNVFVYANDLNPESFNALVKGVAKNKVGKFVTPFNEDGRTFIVDATRRLYNEERTIHLTKKYSRTDKQTEISKSREKFMTQPKLFSHFVMNLPASALSFLPSFVGLYAKAGVPKGSRLPKIHVYCFNTKSADNLSESEKICEEISELLGFKFRPRECGAEGEVSIFDVRDVAPKKRMFCASFRLPEEVAFRTTT